LVVVPGDRRVNLKKVAETLRSKNIKLLPFDQAESVSGYPPGGTPSVHHKTKMKVVVDRTLMSREKIFCGGGTRDRLLELRMFSSLIPELKKILDRVISESRFPSSHDLENVEYEEESMRAVNLEILKMLGMPERTFRMDVSTHPFTVGLSLEDVRITTRYEGKSFRESMYSVIHECGHALYDLQVDRSLEYTPVAGGTSLGVHESQSRFWENMVGRSRAFTHLTYPILKKHLDFVSGYSEEEVYRYFNMVRPNPIRVAADELTYNFHIVLRYEVEKKLIAGDISVAEVPSIWNERMLTHLGI
jgi:carboxypeptidase Taq